jgi:ABC-type uncharacterized transport system auxiliary subunit
MANLKVKPAFGLIVTLVSLAGCTGKIQYPSYYVLNLPAPVLLTSRATPLLGSVAVREFDAPRFLRTGPIVYRDTPEKLGFYEYHRWAVDPRSAVTSAVVRQMEATGVFKSVGAYDGRGTPDFIVTGEIDHLEEVDHSSDVSIEVAVSARLIDTQTGDVIWQDAVSKTTRLDQHSVPRLVTEMSGTMKTVVAGLVSSLQDRVLAASSADLRAGSEQ